MNKNKMKVLEVTGLDYSYNIGQKSKSINILSNLNFEILEGEAVALLGPSGSGKSTFLNCVGLLDAPSRGVIKICEKLCKFNSDSYISKIRAKNIGFVFQNHRLFPEFSAIENVIIPQLVCGVDYKKAKQNANELLLFLGLKHRLDHRFSELSGGEGQRVAIARALANAPKLILADEPTGNLDKENSDLIFDLLYKTVKASNISCIIVTHNSRLAKKVDKVYKIENKNINLISGMI